MTEYERTFSLQVPSSTENLAMIRGFVNSICSQAGLDETETTKFEMAVDEACANVIEHGHEHDVTKEVSIRVKFDQDAVQVTVLDSGKGFDPNSLEGRDLKSLVAARRNGGLGISIMKNFMDEVHYEIVPGLKNELRMVKKLKK